MLMISCWPDTHVGVSQAGAQPKAWIRGHGCLAAHSGQWPGRGGSLSLHLLQRGGSMPDLLYFPPPLDLNGLATAVSCCVCSADTVSTIPPLSCSRWGLAFSFPGHWPCLPCMSSWWAVVLPLEAHEQGTQTAFFNWSPRLSPANSSYMSIVSNALPLA